MFVVECGIFYLMKDRQFWTVFLSEAERFAQEAEARYVAEHNPTIPYCGEDENGHLRPAPPVTIREVP
jgi:hypothetical protein